MILDGYISFLDELFERISDHGIDISEYELDHIGYQADSDADYDRLIPEFLKIGDQVHENLVGGRKVSIFKLSKPLKYENFIITAAELVAPKKGQKCVSSFEHVEFVIDEKFADFMKRYPLINWDTTAANQPNFPMIKLQLDEHMQVKFHYEPVLQIIRNLKK